MFQQAEQAKGVKGGAGLMSGEFTRNTKGRKTMGEEVLCNM